MSQYYDDQPDNGALKGLGTTAGVLGGGYAGLKASKKIGEGNGEKIQNRAEAKAEAKASAIDGKARSYNKGNPGFGGYDPIESVVKAENAGASAWKHAATRHLNGDAVEPVKALSDGEMRGVNKSIKKMGYTPETLSTGLQKDYKLGFENAKDAILREHGFHSEGAIDYEGFKNPTTDMADAHKQANAKIGNAKQGFLEAQSEQVTRAGVEKASTRFSMRERVNLGETKGVKGHLGNAKHGAFKGTSWLRGGARAGVLGIAGAALGGIAVNKGMGMLLDRAQPQQPMQQFDPYAAQAVAGVPVVPPYGMGPNQLALEMERAAPQGQGVSI